MRVRSLPLFLGSLLLALAAAPARAHLGSTKYLVVEPTEGGARVEVAVGSPAARISGYSASSW